jgi:hypothetical protein
MRRDAQLPDDGKFAATPGYHADTSRLTRLTANAAVMVMAVLIIQPLAGRPRPD